MAKRIPILLIFTQLLGKIRIAPGAEKINSILFINGTIVCTCETDASLTRLQSFRKEIFIALIKCELEIYSKFILLAVRQQEPPLMNAAATDGVTTV